VAIFFVCGAGAMANYYMALGWFGRYGKQVLSVVMLPGAILFLVVSTSRKRE
jgi:hypothetical protein